MTGRITLGLLADDDVSLVARIFMDARADVGVQMQETLLTAGQPLSIDAIPGHYAIQLLLPSGATIRKACDVAGEGVTRMDFDVRNLSTSGLSKSAVGPRSISARSERAESRDPESRIREASTIRRKINGVENGTWGTGAQSLGGRKSYGDHSGRHLVASLKLATNLSTVGPSDPAFPLSPSNSGAEQINILRSDDHRSGDTRMWKQAAEGPRGWLTGVQEPRMVVLRKHLDDGVPGWTISDRPSTAKGRHWALASTPTMITVISLPFPWRDRNGAATLELHAGTSALGPLSVTLRHTGMDGFVAYLENGRMSLLKPFLAEIEKSGREDRLTDGYLAVPLEACLAAFVWMSVRGGSSMHSWEHRIEDLVQRYPEIPDLHVIRAYLIRLRGRDPVTMESFDRSLGRALDIGIPYLSMGLRLLRDLLTMMPDASFPAATRRSIESVAARCDPRAIPTTLRYSAVS